MKLSLLRNGRSAGDLDLSLGDYMVGRRENNAIRISHPSVSGRHARFFHAFGTVFIEDMGSTNGTFVNNRQVIGGVQLRDGDVIQFGEVELTVSSRELAASRNLPTAKFAVREEVVSPAAEEKQAKKISRDWGYELLLPNEDIEWVGDLAALRRMLVEGKATASTYVRPVKARQRNGAAGGASTVTEGQPFRRIGDTLARTRFQIRSLYNPQQAYSRRGEEIGFIAFAGLAALLLASLSWQIVVTALLFGGMLMLLRATGLRGSMGVGAALLLLYAAARVSNHLGPDSRLGVYLLAFPFILGSLEAGRGRAIAGYIGIGLCGAAFGLIAAGQPHGRLLLGAVAFTLVALIGAALGHLAGWGWWRWKRNTLPVLET